MEPKVLLTRGRRSGIRRPSHWCPRRKTWYYVHTSRHRCVVCWVPFQGFHLRSVRPLGGRPLDVLILVPPPEFRMRRVKPGTQAAEGSHSHLAPVDSTVFGQLPNIVQHCCVTRYDDGTARQPGWLTIRSQGSAWVVQLKDPDSGCQMRANGNTLDDALALAELLLGAEEAPWEPDPWLASQKKRGKKQA